MKTILYTLSLLILVVSCKSKQIAQSEKVVVTKIKTDTFRMLEKQTVQVPFVQEVKLPCDSVSQYTFSSGLYDFTLKTEKGKATLQTQFKGSKQSDKQTYQSKNTKADSIQIKQQTITKTEKYTPFWVECFAWFGAIHAVGWLIFMIIKTRKLWTSF